MPDAAVEATAGAVGSLLTCFLLYPIDTVKLRIQSGRSKAGTVGTIRDIVRDESILALFKGLPAKAVHAVVNNYLYFYAYELLKKQRAALGVRASTPANTVCGVLAGIANLTMTLPLDTYVVRLQLGDRENKRSAGALALELIGEGPRGLWRGFGVSTVLTINPALTFAVFDALKAYVTKLLRVDRLSALQAFVIASTAKLIATFVTYPLIRTKTVLQQRRSGDRVGAGSGAAAANGGTDGGSATADGARSVGMAQVLLDILREEGIVGWYRGIGAQCITAVGKSGILLTTKEKIAAFAMGLLVLLGRRNQKRLAGSSGVR